MGVLEVIVFVVAVIVTGYGSARGSARPFFGGMTVALYILLGILWQDIAKTSADRGEKALHQAKIAHMAAHAYAGRVKFLLSDGGIGLIETRIPLYMVHE